MRSQSSRLLEAFDALPAEEQRIFTAAFFRRVIPFDSGPLDDEESAHAADALFDALNTEEQERVTMGECPQFPAALIG